MIDWIRRLFGKGKVRVEFKGINRNGKIVSGDAKVPYVGAWDENDVIKHIKNEIMYQHGIVVTEAKIVSHIQD